MLVMVKLNTQHLKTENPTFIWIEKLHAYKMMKVSKVDVVVTNQDKIQHPIQLSYQNFNIKKLQSVCFFYIFFYLPFLVSKQKKP